MNERYIFNVTNYNPQEDMKNSWVLSCGNLLTNPDAKSLQTFKHELMNKSKHPYIRVSHFAVEEIHAFITSLPKQYRTIAMSYALKKLFRYLFRTKILLANHPVWIRTIKPLGNVNMMLWFKFDTLKNAEKKFRGIRKNISVTHTRKYDFYTRSWSKFLAATIFKFKDMENLHAEKVSENTIKNLGNVTGLKEIYFCY